MKEFEDAILIRRYNKELPGMNYKSTEKVASIVKWQEIQQEYQVKKSFNKVIRNLISKMFIDDHGKRGEVASLSKIGTQYVRELQDNYKLSLL